MFIHPVAEGPAAFNIGPIYLPYYGLAYFLAFLTYIYLGEKRLSFNNFLSAEKFLELSVLLMLNALLGGRVGYFIEKAETARVAIYWFIFGLSCLYLNYFLRNNITRTALFLGIIRVVTGNEYQSLLASIVSSSKIPLQHSGMSFYGGVLAALIAIRLYSRRYKYHPLDLLDFITPLTPPGIALGRFTNFLNGELYGRPTNLPWGVIFLKADDVARHPSQLYECALEGILLFIILWRFSSQRKQRGATSGLGMSCYAVFRIMVEFVREPDQRALFKYKWLTAGQLLSIPMLIAGTLLFIYSKKLASKKLQRNLPIH